MVGLTLFDVLYYKKVRWCQGQHNRCLKWWCIGLKTYKCQHSLGKFKIKYQTSDRHAQLKIFLFAISSFQHVDRLFPIKLVSAVQCVSLTPTSFCTRKAAPIQSDRHHGHGMLKSTFFPFSKEKRPFKANQLEMLLCFYFRLNFLEPIMQLSGMYI